jgi:hypothetical protein
VEPLSSPVAGLLAAGIQTGVLARSLLVAVVVVAPYWWWKRRQVRAARAERAAALAPAAEPEVPAGPRLEDVVAEISAAAADLPGGATTTVTVPAGVTVDGSVVAPELADTLVRDALRRSGLVATAEVDTADGRVIECRRA